MAKFSCNLEDLGIPGIIGQHEVKFRNANGVSLKISNILAIDPNYMGKGMQCFRPQLFNIDPDYLDIDF